jgi:hypothetical protein
MPMIYIGELAGSAEETLRLSGSVARPTIVISIMKSTLGYN